MKSIYFIIAIITGLLVLSGCNNENQESGPSTTPFAGGSNGLSMEFIPGAPPTEILDNGNQDFSITVKLENLGEDDVLSNDGYVEITGIDPTDFGLNGQNDLKQDIPEEVKGVVKNFQGVVLVGDTVVTEFNDLVFESNIRGNWDKPRIRANACYNYETQASTAVCIKDDLLANIDNTEICSLTGEKEVYNSGAPIHITKVSQTPQGTDKIQVQFEISHVGSANDRFYKVDTDCDDSPSNSDKDIVFFEVETDINGNLAKCSGLNDGDGDNEGFIELYNGQSRIVVCTFEVGDVEGTFQKQITANLEYRYYQFIEQRLLIKDVSTSDE